MTPERHRRLEEICLGALQREPAGRAAFIADTCAGDEALRRDVEALLVHAEDAELFMERPALDIAAATFARGLTPIGRQIGPYTVVSSLGSGGMGDVYRARDSLLKRDVALKILPPFVGLDADRRARFEREARLLASLNHSHIGAIYELEQFDGMPVLVLELVEGETLANRVTRGPLPLNDALAFGRDITDALEAAHEKGIVHCDLKPANIKVTPDGTVKVLDFGLAKALATDSGTNMQASAEPALTARRPPVILGTPAYMSPEQAQGIAVDKRTDIWAFGCVLYEMLTGTPAFQGTTISDTMASVIAREPEWRALPAHTPPAIRRLLHRCLEKDRKHRLADIADARLELADAQVPEAPPQATRPHGAWLPWSLAGLFLIAAMVMLFVHARERPDGVQLLRAQVPLPDTARTDAPIVMSPDGRSLASIVGTAGANAAGHLWIHSFASGRWQELAHAPVTGGMVWSPDSRFIGFHSDGKLRTIDVTSGAIRSIVDVPRVNGSGTWSSDDLIVFATPTGLMRVSAAGGSALPLTALNHARGEIGHFFPRFLPDGRHFIYLRVSPGADVTGLYIGSLDVKPDQQNLTRIVATRTNGEYAPSATNPALGDLLFVREGTLIIQRFDAARQQLVGDPVPLAEQIAELGVPSARFANFSVSTTGVLAYRQRQVVTGTPVWVDRIGRELASVVDTPLDELINVRLSPDGSRLAVIAAGNVWVYDLTGRPPIKLTFDGGNDMPLWTPDGQRVIYGRTAPPLGLLSVSAVQGGTPEAISPEGHYHPHGWSPGGDLIAVLNSYSPTWWDVLRFSPGKRMDPIPLLQTPRFEGARGAALSPDGRWLAYTFDGTGREEVWVAPYPDLGAPERVSSNGGADPVWAKKGRELYYVEGRKMMSVPVQTAPLFRFERATMLFESSYGPEQFPNASYDVAGDGRFLMIKNATPPAMASPVHIVLNWQEELKQRVPTR